MKSLSLFGGCTENSIFFWIGVKYVVCANSLCFVVVVVLVRLSCCYCNHIVLLIHLCRSSIAHFLHHFRCSCLRALATEDLKTHDETRRFNLQSVWIGNRNQLIVSSRCFIHAQIYPHISSTIAATTTTTTVTLNTQRSDQVSEHGTLNMGFSHKFCLFFQFGFAISSKFIFYRTIWTRHECLQTNSINLTSS